MGLHGRRVGETCKDVLTRALVETFQLLSPDPVINGLFQLAGGLRFIIILKGRRAE
jgi:hypothetical protein